MFVSIGDATIINKNSTSKGDEVIGGFALELAIKVSALGKSASFLGGVSSDTQGKKILEHIINNLVLFDPVFCNSPLPTAVFECSVRSEKGGTNLNCEACSESGGSGLECNACPEKGGTNLNCEACSESGASGLECNACPEKGGSNLNCEACSESGASGLECNACSEKGGTNLNCEACSESGGSGLECNACPEKGGTGLEHRSLFETSIFDIDRFKLAEAFTQNTDINTVFFGGISLSNSFVANEILEFLSAEKGKKLLFSPDTKSLKLTKITEDPQFKISRYLKDVGIATKLADYIFVTEEDMSFFDNRLESGFLKSVSKGKIIICKQAELLDKIADFAANIYR